MSSHLISVEIAADLAGRLVDDPSNWTYKDKDRLLNAIQEALDNEEMKREN